MDYEIGEYLYRIKTWGDCQRQDREFTIVKAPYDVGDFKVIAEFDTLEEAQNFIKNIKDNIHLK